ncbi:MAG: SDR family oxidoreductase [Flavobacteriales bacterium]|nr:SDR family oxidoreductase [Flavobacteriales bacterium]
MEVSPFSKMFTDKRIIIVGSAFGHGEYLSKSFHFQNAQVLLIDSSEKVHELKKKLGKRAESYVLDVRDSQKIKSLSDDIGSVDGIIYLPRARIRKPFFDLTSSEFDEEISISLRGALLFAQNFSLKMNLNKKNYPFIITISSILAQVIGSESVSYHVSKAGLEQLTRYLAVELGSYGIRVNSVALGWTIKEEQMENFYSELNFEYRLMAENLHALPYIGTSEDVFQAVAFLASEKAKFITGQIINLDGGITIQEQSHLYLNKMKNFLNPNSCDEI